jgi:protein-L-isoaspartate(D-aspartate) O-methyltransferase
MINSKYRLALTPFPKLVVFSISMVLIFCISSCSVEKKQMRSQDYESAMAGNIFNNAFTSSPPLPAPFDIEKRKDNPPLDSKSNFIKWRLSVSKEEEKYISARWDLAAEAIKRKEITEQRVLEAFLRTPREFFARQFNKARAYDDAALGIGYGQTISGPHLVAKMTNELNPAPGEKVLEIGTGSGYQSAIFAQLSNYVYSIEIIEPLSNETDKLYKSLFANYPELANVKRKIADGYFGWPEYAPFDRIAVTCGIDHIPPALIEQLAPDGIMLIPVGPPNGQTMLRVTKKVAPNGSYTIEREDVYKGRYYPVFVPFTSEGGKGRHSLGKGETKE